MNRQIKVRLLWLALTLVLGAMCVGVLYLSVQLAGILNTIIYTGLFLFGLLSVPLFIMLKFTDVFAGATLGKLHFLLGQFAFGTGVLFQRGDEHELTPGRKTADGYEAWIDGEWTVVQDDHNVSILGMRPFLYAPDKESRSFKEKRVDPSALSEMQSDGGSTVTRAGVAETPPPADVSGLDDEMVVDLKRVFESGLKRVGDISLIEKAEEIEQRNQSKDSITDTWGPVIGSVVGLLIGIVMGFAMLGGF